MRVTPPVLPPLPLSPSPASPWVGRTNPSASIVQKQYVDQRLEELGANSGPAKQAALKVLEDYLLALPANRNQKKVPFKELDRIYNQIRGNLQAADLTVNFNCSAWFTQENPYDTYTQMYERAVQGGKMVLKSVGTNDARARAEVDNQVTFPAEWRGTQTAPQRGLSPGRQSPDRIMRQMDTGQLTPTGEDDGGYNAGNRHFNPHTKQVFLGLNYGRRPHGSARNFGSSYFVLTSQLKSRCFFYAGDTFYQYGGSSHAGDLQVPYHDLAALLGKVTDINLRRDLFRSCYECDAG